MSTLSIYVRETPNSSPLWQNFDATGLEERGLGTNVGHFVRGSVQSGRLRVLSEIDFE